ncbi:hypothetical protein DFH06DRAFT_1066508 [Mycena polygramma]|nr:hypothetical protein DFH06DRAFT_1066508 [Mycena polygramma]
MGSPVFALIVGINQYRAAKIPNLYGCVKDAECIRAMLLQLSQGTAQIHFLIDEDATQARVTQAFQTHLADNPLIRRGDPIIIYFAGRGRRLEASVYGLGRDVDVLLPHDCDESVLGISDFTVCALLYDLAQKKGSNITVILDTCFPCLFPRWDIGHRSDTSPPMAPDAYISWHDQTAHSCGFYCSSRVNVLLAACRENELAGETSQGGTFTQALVAEVQRNHKRTCREVCEAIELTCQHPVCLGMHADEPLFAMAPDFRITKLRVFVGSPSISLELNDKDDFVRVWKKTTANLVLSLNEDGGIIVERLDGLIAVYASRKVSVPEQNPQSLSLLLNKIARFSYYLTVEPPSPHFSLWRRILSYLRIPHRFPWARRLHAIEFFQLALNDQGVVMFDQEFTNLLKEDVVYLDQSTLEDRVYGLKITNCFTRKLYPRLFYFNPGNYSIMPVALGSGDSESLQPGSSVTLGMDGHAWQFTPDPDGGRDAGFFKLFMLTSAADVSYIRQDSALKLGGENSELLSCTPHSSIFWDTSVATVALRPSWMHCVLWRSWLSRIFSRLSPPH